MPTVFSFGEKVSLIEEAIVELLFDEMPYVRVVSTYNGELGDRDKLVEALRTLKNDFPLVLVGYTGGTDEVVRRPATPNGPTELIHHGTVEIVSCADDSLAQFKHVRGAAPLTRKGGMALTHRMFSDTRALLTNRQFTKTVGGDEKVILNEGELVPQDNDYVERITGMTAVSTPFTLSFSYVTPGAPAPPSGVVNLINFSIDSPAGGALTQLPGIHREAA
jgi:hypothetical protein